MKKDTALHANSHQKSRGSLLEKNRLQVKSYHKRQRSLANDKKSQLEKYNINTCVPHIRSPKCIKQTLINLQGEKDNKIQPCATSRQGHILGNVSLYDFYHCTIIGCTYTNLDCIAYYTYRLQGTDYCS